MQKSACQPNQALQLLRTPNIADLLYYMDLERFATQMQILKSTKLETAVHFYSPVSICLNFPMNNRSAQGVEVAHGNDNDGLPIINLIYFIVPIVWTKFSLLWS